MRFICCLSIPGAKFLRIFNVRGGLDVLEAFAILHEHYPQLRLTMRTALPALDDHYYQILESG